MTKTILTMIKYTKTRIKKGFLTKHTQMMCCLYIYV